MISYAAAVEIIHAAAHPLPARPIRLEEALGTVAAAEIRSPAAVPPFANAAMDGFALCSADTRAASTDAPVRLAVAGRIAAGQAPPAATPAGSAWEIMTGAAMPKGCDAVIAVERTEALTRQIRAASGDTGARAAGGGAKPAWRR